MKYEIEILAGLFTTFLFLTIGGMLANILSLATFSFLILVGIVVVAICIKNSREQQHKRIVDRHNHLYKSYRQEYIKSNRYIPDNVRKQVLERDDYQCVYCGSTLYLEIDHIIPISRGGDSQIDNLQILCRSCNASKGAS